MNPPLKIIGYPDCFQGVGESPLPTPTQILLFYQTTKQNLQQGCALTPSHHRCVLWFNLETKGDAHIDSRVLPFSPGQAITILPFQFHHASHLASQQLRWMICTFELENTDFIEPLKNQVLDLSPTTLGMRDGLAEEWLRWNNPALRSFMQAEQLQATILRLLLALKEDLMGANPYTPPDSEDNLVNKVNRYLFEWQKRRFTIDNLAEEMDLSTSQLRSRFRRTAGVSLGGYIQTFRIYRAIALLHSPNLSISEIAEETGFSSVHAFSRAFKNMIGQSPLAYRNSK